MLTEVVLEHWDWPLLKAEPQGFDHILIDLYEPSQKVRVKAAIPLKDAWKFAERLQQLIKGLEHADVLKEAPHA